MANETKTEVSKPETTQVEQPAKVENKVSMSAEELQAEIDSLKASKERILKESKEHANKYREMRDSLDEKEKLDLQKKEDWKKLLEKEIEKRQGLEKKLGGLKTKVVNKTLDLEIARLAPDAQSIDSLKKLLPIDLLNVEEQEDEILISGVKEAIDRMRTEQPYLFKSSTQAKMISSKPGMQKNEPITLDKMDTKSLARLLVQTRAKQI